MVSDMKIVHAAGRQAGINSAVARGLNASLARVAKTGLELGAAVAKFSFVVDPSVTAGVKEVASLTSGGHVQIAQRFMPAPTHPIEIPGAPHRHSTLDR